MNLATGCDRGRAVPSGTGLIGVLGGMGPLATVDFMRKVLQATCVHRDQDHVPMIVSCIPQVPDRAAAFRGEGDSPLAAIVENGQRLMAGGARLLVMPCNTAHLWFDAIRLALQVPMLHLVDAALDDVEQMPGEHRRIGLLATDATLASGLYTNRDRGRRRPVEWLLPTVTEISNQVTPGIEAVKGGRLADASDLLTSAAQSLVKRGASVLVMGCTEIPLALEPARAGCPLIDAGAALARRAVAWSLAERGMGPPTT